MIYLRNYKSHSDYNSDISNIPNHKPVVIWDNEHIHFISGNTTTIPTEEQQPTVAKYKLTVEVTDTDWGNTDSLDYLYAENDTINNYIEHLSIIYFSYIIYNADTNEKLTNSPITVTQSTNGFTVGGTMPIYNVKVSITVSSLA